MGDLSFLSRQAFPDKGERLFFLIHWYDRITSIYAIAEVGKFIQIGVLIASVFKGLIHTSSNVKRYYTTKLYTICESSSVVLWVTAKESGEDSNLGADVELTVASSLSTGLDSTIKVASDCISGGIN